MHLFQVAALAVIQGFAELLPVSSSAHVILAEKWMGLDPTAPDMTLLLVMLHTGTMFAVIAYFWRDWKETYFSSSAAFRRNAGHVVLATAATGVVGLALLKLIPMAMGVSHDSFEIEQLFGNPRLMAFGLAAAGLLILVSGLRQRGSDTGSEIEMRTALAIGAVQGLCLPVRGFSRSGSTISAGLLMKVAKDRAEAFSFALAVVLTPAVIAREVHRFLKVHAASGGAGASGLLSVAWPSLTGMLLSFAAGLAALRWLSRWLERGRWHYFGIYCLVASAVVLATQGRGA